MRLPRILLPLLILTVLSGWLHPPAQHLPDPAPTAQSAAVQPTAQNNTQNLPPEAHAVIRRILQHQPHPYAKDGTTFHNREGRLPAQPRGYYREYTVPTPGERNRGARRLITGGDPPEIWYYTPDHYQTFRRITP